MPSGQAHRQTNTRKHTDTQANAISRNQVLVATGRAPGLKIVIVWGAAEHYYNFHTCIVDTIDPNTTANHTVTK